MGPTLVPGVLLGFGTILIYSFNTVLPLCWYIYIVYILLCWYMYIVLSHFPCPPVALHYTIRLTPYLP